MTNYQCTEVKSSGLVHEFKVTIPYQEIESNINAEAEKLKEKVNIPGFRKGKAPLHLIKQKHGPELLQESIETCFQNTMKKLFADKNIKPALEPKVDFKQYNKGNDFEFDVYVENTPKFTVPDFKTMTVQRHAVEITDYSLDKELKRFQEEMKEFSAVTDKNYKAKNGDVVVIDFVGKVDGEAFKGGTAEDHELELGSKSFIDTFEEQLVGHKIGDKIDVNVTFPADYHSENLKGKPSLFEVTIKGIKSSAILPELTDELVAKLNVPTLKTLEDLKNDITKKLEKEFKVSAHHMSKKDLFDQLEKDFSQDLPPTLVTAEIEQVKKADPSLNDEDATNLAKRRVALSLLFIEISDQQKIRLTQDDYRNAIFNIANQYPGAEMQIVDLYMKNKFLLDSLHGSILEEKVVTWILNQVKFNETNIKDNEFVELIK